MQFIPELLNKKLFSINFNAKNLILTNTLLTVGLIKR